MLAAACGFGPSVPVVAADPPPGYPAKADVLAAFDCALPERHPYLLYGRGGADEFRARISRRDVPVMCALRAGVVSRADALMARPPLPRKLVGRRMLTGIGLRCHLLAAAFLATGEEKYARRGVTEMLAAADYPDWNPAHFLDTATVALGVAIGYDACWDKMTEAERAKISSALAEKCIAAARGHWFWNTPCNWSHVCGCGVAAAALAIARDAGRLELAAETVAACCRAARVGATAYAPCGVYPEGAAYWSYGTDRFVLLMDMLQKTCGRDFGLYEMPGVAQTGAFINAITAPSGEYFDFSDRNACADGFYRGMEWSLFWLGAAAGHAEWYARENEALGRAGCAKLDRVAWPIPCAMWWRPSADTYSLSVGTSYFPHDVQPIALLRDTCNWVAVKGGKAASNHGHMDAGSFVYETYGAGWAQRWVCEGGTEDYNALETAGIDLWNMAQSSSRWSVYRYGARAHAVFTIDDAPPRVDALVTLVPSGASEFAADTTGLYPDCAASVKRTFRLSDGALSVSDAFAGVVGSHTYRWAFPTRADPEVANGGVVLSARGRRITVTASRDGIWSVERNPRGRGTENVGLCRVVFTSALRDGEYRFDFAACDPPTPPHGGGFWRWFCSLFGG